MITVVKELRWVNKAHFVMTIYADDHIIWANEYANNLFGDPLAGRYIYETVAPEYHDMVRLRLAHLAEGVIPEISIIEIRYLNSMKESVWIRSVATMVQWNKKPAIMGIGVDVSKEHALSGAIVRLIMDRLSPREAEFLEFTARGFSVQDIAERWGWYKKSVGNLPGKVRAKLGIDETEYDEIVNLVFRYFFYKNT